MTLNGEGRPPAKASTPTASLYSNIFALNSNSQPLLH